MYPVSDKNPCTQFILDNAAGYNKTHSIFTVFSTLGFPKTQTWLFLETYQLISSNQKYFNIK